LRERGVAVTGGSAFGLPGYIRIAYMNGPEQDVCAAIELLANSLASPRS
jgi:aspartate/methionine/tyrosine aminotransferase